MRDAVSELKTAIFSLNCIYSTKWQIQVYQHVNMGSEKSIMLIQIHFPIFETAKHGFKVRGDFWYFAYPFCTYLSSYFRSFEILKFFVVYDLQIEIPNYVFRLLHIHGYIKWNLCWWIRDYWEKKIWLYS